MEFVTILIFCIIFIIGVAFVVGLPILLISTLSKHKSDEKTKFEQELGALADFTPTRRLGYYPGIVLDERRRKVCLIDEVRSLPRFRVYDFKDILSCEVFEDGVSILKSVRESEIGDALLGGIRVSPVGAAIGKTAQQSEDYVYTDVEPTPVIALELVINDGREPVHGMVLSGMKYLQDTIPGQEPSGTARMWYELLREVMRQSDARDRKALPQAGEYVSAATANELSKLVGSLERWEITEEEFERQKVSVLAR